MLYYFLKVVIWLTFGLEKIFNKPKTFNKDSKKQSILFLPPGSIMQVFVHVEKKNLEFNTKTLIINFYFSKNEKKNHL